MPSSTPSGNDCARLVAESKATIAPMSNRENMVIVSRTIVPPLAGTNQQKIMASQAGSSRTFRTTKTPIR